MKVASNQQSYDRRHWKKEKSWNWATDTMAVAHIFAISGWETIKFDDLSTLSTLWKNCSEFSNKLPKLTKRIDKLREIRNNITHDATLALTDKQKAKYFSEIDKFFLEDELKNVKLSKPIGMLHQEYKMEVSQSINENKIQRIREEIKELTELLIESRQTGEATFKTVFLILKILLLGLLLLPCSVLSVMCVISKPGVVFKDNSPEAISCK